MNALDILILCVGGSALFMGYIRGLVAQMGQIVAVVAGVVVSRMFGPVLSSLFAGGADTTATSDIAGYILTFVAAYVAVWLIFRLARRTIHCVHLAIVDRLAGAAFKAGLWLLVLSMVLNVWYLIRGEDDSLRRPDRPWRAAVIDMAPALLGYLADIENNDKAADVETTTPGHDTDNDEKQS